MKRAALTLAILFSFLQQGTGKTTKQYQKEIQSGKNTLQQLKKTLEDKRSEKEQCLQEEKSIRKELARVEQELNRLSREREKLRREIRKAEKNLALTEKELQAAGWEKNQWLTVLGRETDLWFRSHHSHYQLFQDPVLEKLRLEALSQKKSFVTNAQVKEENTRRSLEKWEAAKKRLLALKQRQEATARERETVRSQKENLLCTTRGRRIVAEEEIAKLSESARALERLIENLIREKRKIENEAAAKRKFQEKKKLLPWPVSGDVVVKFGRNKHPEFDTFVISNGIKIHTVPGAAVNAVNSGEVIFCGEFRAYGLMVILDHGGGFCTIYGLLGEAAVEEGQKIKAGESVGRTGVQGESLFYFEVRSAGKVEDPLLWLK